VDWRTLEIVNLNAAGIDAGDGENWVAISPDRNMEPVRRFGCITGDPRETGRWLIEKGARSVPCRRLEFTARHSHGSANDFLENEYR
jgi:hypothetical protein